MKPFCARLLLSLCLSCSLLQGPRPASAQGKVPVRPMMVRWSQQVPLLTFSSREFLTKEVEKKLKSGLPQRLVTRVYAYPKKGKEPISAGISSCKVVYDLWEGVFRVQRSMNTRDDARVARSTAQVAELCLDVQKLAVGNARAFTAHRGKQIYFAAIIELNPLSPDTVRRIRRWLSRSGGGGLEGDAFFGSFVSIFVSRRMGSAERTTTFRSRTMSVPR